VESVAGLRSVLEEVESPDQYSDAQQYELPFQGHKCLPSAHAGTRDHISSDPNRMLFEPSNKAGHIDVTLERSNFLLDVYHERVHALFKALHWPSTLALFDASNDSGDTNIQALKSAVYFTSVCSLCDHEMEGRRVILSQYRQRAEEAFIDAGLLTTTSFIALQAFVIYLVSTETTTR
jgi:hypothetical protein